MQIANKTFLVLGASGVLGQEMVRQLTSEGAIVLATSSSVDSAKRIPSAARSTFVLDFTSNESIESAAASIGQNALDLDGVINCSGQVGFGTIAETTPEHALHLMQVNHLGPAALITRLLPQLLTACEKNGEAVVVGITGVVAERSFPGLAAYGESKLAASRHLAALAQEFRRVKLKTLDARPGHTETGLADRAAFGTAPAFPTGMTAEHVVTKIVHAMKDGKSELPSSDF